MKQNMKKLMMFLGLAPLMLTGCYDDYTMDYDYNAVYVAYQYDLRTFVVGEGMKFDFTVAFGGAVANGRDRSVEASIDNSLLTEDLSGYTTAFGVGSFTALDGLKGSAPFGTLSQKYVTSAVSGLSALTPLPETYYTADGLGNMTIRKGRHTAAVTVKAEDAILSDPNAFKPYYALGFKVDRADADTVLMEKSFEIIVVKCENRFFGTWYHGGRTVVRNDATGETVSSDSYELKLPQADDKTYTLTTVDAKTVKTDKVGLKSGTLLLTFDGDDITVSSPDGSVEYLPIDGQPSRFNGAKLLQDRKIELNYKFSNGDGTTTYVTDCLQFRNRIRDGVNEWQSENEEDYK